MGADARGRRVQRLQVLGGIRIPTWAEVYRDLDSGRFVYWRRTVTSAGLLDQPFHRPGRGKRAQSAPCVPRPGAAKVGSRKASSSSRIFHSLSGPLFIPMSGAFGTSSPGACASALRANLILESVLGAPPQRDSTART